MKETLIKRIFTPYLHEYFWWMGDGTAHVNNWTVWCTQNVLIAAALTPIEESMRQQIFLKACRSIDYFLDGKTAAATKVLIITATPAYASLDAWKS